MTRHFPARPGRAGPGQGTRLLPVPAPPSPARAPRAAPGEAGGPDRAQAAAGPRPRRGGGARTYSDPEAMALRGRGRGAAAAAPRGGRRLRRGRGGRGRRAEGSGRPRWLSLSADSSAAAAPPTPPRLPSNSVRRPIGNSGRPPPRPMGDGEKKKRGAPPMPRPSLCSGQSPLARRHYLQPIAARLSLGATAPARPMAKSHRREHAGGKSRLRRRR